MLDYLDLVIAPPKAMSFTRDTMISWRSIAPKPAWTIARQTDRAGRTQGDAVVVAGEGKMQVIERFIRHPVNIPIEVQPLDRRDNSVHHTYNLSVRGLAFDCDQRFSRGDIVGITITFVRPSFEVNARVIWCKARADKFDLGVEFLNEEDAFLARMVEQVCQIENYKRFIHREHGRILSQEEAAQEWVNKFASKFPGASGRD